MKTKRLLPYYLCTLLFSVILISILKDSKGEVEKNNMNETKNSQKARYTFSLQLFQTN
jgi:hypothetical protein